MCAKLLLELTLRVSGVHDPQRSSYREEGVRLCETKSLENCETASLSCDLPDADQAEEVCRRKLLIEGMAEA